MPFSWAAARPRAIWTASSTDLRAPSEPRGHAVAERLALQQLGDDVGRAVVLPGVVDGDDVGMVEDAGGPGLLLEAADAVRGRRRVGVEDLEGDLAGEAQVLGAVDLAHAAPPRRATTSYGPTRVPAARLAALLIDLGFQRESNLEPHRSPERRRQVQVADPAA